MTKNELFVNNTQDFPLMLDIIPICEDDEDVTYDVMMLFTNIPLKDTIHSIYEEIYIHKKVEPICKKSIFKKLLYKLTREWTFSATGKLQKQVDGLSIGGTLSVRLSWIKWNEILYCQWTQNSTVNSLMTHTRGIRKTSQASYFQNWTPSNQK